MLAIYRHPPDPALLGSSATPGRRAGLGVDRLRSPPNDALAVLSSVLCGCRLSICLRHSRCCSQDPRITDARAMRCKVNSNICATHPSMHFPTCLQGTPAIHWIVHTRCRPWRACTTCWKLCKPTVRTCPPLCQPPRYTPTYDRSNTTIGAACRGAAGAVVGGSAASGACEPGSHRAAGAVSGQSPSQHA